MYQFTHEEKRVIEKTLNRYGIHHQIIVAIEELSELAQATIHGDLDSIFEELADVQISLATLSLCNIKFGGVVREGISRTERCLNLIKDLTKLLRYDTHMEYKYDTISEMQFALDFYLNMNILETTIKAKIKRLEERINRDSSNSNYNFYMHRFMAQK